MMCVIIDNIIYHTESSRYIEGDYLYLCGLRFPLKKSETVLNMEKRYIKRNSEYFKQFQNNYIANIKLDTNLLDDINREIVQNKNIHFFLSEIIPIYMDKKIQFTRIDGKNKDDSIFERLLERDVALINKRFFPLYEIGIPSSIKVSGKNYFFKTSKKTLDKFEAEFKYNLEERLKKEVLEKIDESKEIKERILNLENEVRDIVAKRHILHIGNCFEYGDMGYDCQSQRVYCILPPHYNKTTRRGYRERQGAIAVSVKENILLVDTVILFREDQNSDFKVDRTNLCLGINPRGNTTKQIIGYLLSAAENIRWNKACHE